jgi:hypothetical protein
VASNRSVSKANLRRLEATQVQGKRRSATASAVAEIFFSYQSFRFKLGTQERWARISQGAKGTQAWHAVFPLGKHSSAEQVAGLEVSHLISRLVGAGPTEECQM